MFSNSKTPLSKGSENSIPLSSPGKRETHSKKGRSDADEGGGADPHPNGGATAGLRTRDPGPTGESQPRGEFVPPVPPLDQVHGRRNPSKSRSDPLIDLVEFYGVS